ncbi:MAG: hypothetical protein ACRDT6_12580 [Micromonosporaceae bacterium]
MGRTTELNGEAMSYPAVPRVPVRITAGQWVTFGAAAVGLAAYLAALVFDWARISGEGHGLLDLVAQSTRLTSSLFVVYLLLPLVGYAMSAAAALAMPRRRPRAVVAAVAAVCGLAAVVWLAVRISAAGDQVGLGIGWYAGMASVVAACVAAAGSAVGTRVGES